MQPERKALTSRDGKRAATPRRPLPTEFWKEQMNINETVAKAGAVLDRAQEQVEDLGRSAAGTFDETRKETAAALENAASSVRKTGHGGAKTIDTLSQSAASKLDSTAVYVRRHDLDRILTNARQAFGRNPTVFVLLAAGIGFLAGSKVRREKTTG
jgi:hypothetical protein